jgi:outer membrane protein OmpA-like peptidoglycan-associated protein
MRIFLLFSFVILQQYWSLAQVETFTPMRSKIPPYDDSIIKLSNQEYEIQYYKKNQVPIKLKDNLVSFTCYFDYNSKNLAVDSIQNLQNWLTKYTGKKNFVLSLVAYTDTIGSTKYNYELAKNRLNSIENLLNTNAIKIEKRFILGEDYPQFYEYKHKKYRKVDVVVEFDNDEIINPEFQGRMEIFAAATPEIPINLNIQFVGDQSVYLNESSILEVVTLLEFLKKNPNKKAFIRGHVCCANDIELSIQRAFAVYNDLLLEGIDASRISYQGFGNTLPISPEFNEEMRQLNRRVDVIFSDFK